MRAPDFWWRREAGWLARLLSPLGAIYGAITLRRMRRGGISLGIPVICVGNFVAGGAGKTPTAIAIVSRLAARSEAAFVLMRGYGGRNAGPLSVDPARHDAAEVGDEAVLMARHARTIVARERPAGAALARRLGAGIIVMDDGLQNPSLAKTLRIAVVDGAVGVGNGLCLPAGPLRAPLQAQFAHCDVVVVIGEGEPGARVAAQARAAGLAVLDARLAPDPDLADRLAGRTAIAVAGIGRPEKFSATLRQIGVEIVGEHPFADHHAYTPGDVAALLADAVQRDCLVATTQKDMVKLEPLWPAAQRDRLVVVPVALVLDDPAALDALLVSACRRDAA